MIEINFPREAKDVKNIEGREGLKGDSQKGNEKETKAGKSRI